MEIDALHARRDAHRRLIRRRRMAAGMIVAATVAVIAIVVLASGSSGSPRAAIPVAHAGSANRHAGTRPSTSAAARTGPPGTQPLPILMYHVIAAPPPGAPFPGLYVEPEEFAEQMQALKSAGWHAVTLDQVLAYWKHGARLPRGKPIVLTFDNGYHSQYTAALPVLKHLGWVADENIQLSGLPPSQGGLTNGEVRGLVAAG